MWFFTAPVLFVDAAAYYAIGTPSFIQKRPPTPAEGKRSAPIDLKPALHVRVWPDCASKHMKIDNRSYHDNEEIKSTPYSTHDRDNRLGIWIFCSKCHRLSL